jgi:hypothetical protein
MKSLFIRIVLPLFGVLVLSGVYNVGIAASQVKMEAQGEEHATEMSDVDALIAGLADLVTYQQAKEANEMTSFTVGSGATYPVLDGTCRDNWHLLYSSTTRASNTPWDLQFMTFPDEGIQQFIDLNGDGLPDYINSYKEFRNNYNSVLNGAIYSAYIEESSCVYLNDGAGWDIAYQCITASSIVNNARILTYYGDCAQ